MKVLQGRTLINSSLRYITIKIDENFPKIYGLDKINKRETIYVVEGPIDSMFIKNSLAASDSSLESVCKYLNKKDNVILIPDRQPRNPQICNKIIHFIKLGHDVCLLPETLKGKDINEFILNGLSKLELRRIIDTHTYNGLRAELEFAKWKKC